MSQGFKLLHKFTANGVDISKYKSTKTGLSVVIADVDGNVIPLNFINLQNCIILTSMKDLLWKELLRWLQRHMMMMDVLT
jgi:hypothetical protein